jgi:4-diphosphocytidyl-2-C-methyl-D-erythritol kinase
MIRSATLRSLAKVNLDLRVLGKRADGFHDLRTVFQTVSLADRIDLAFEPAHHTTISLDDPLAIPNNLMARAARAVLGVMRVKAAIRLRLRKRIPMGGGLGGGSSNAAAILLALPILAGRLVRFERLQELAAGLGSDVPFFLLGGTALGMGRGEELYGLPEVAEDPILVVSTGLHIATAEAYQALGRGLTSPDLSRYSNEFRLYVRALEERGSAAAVSGLSANDFEPVVFRKHPLLQTIAGKLSKSGAAGVRMTGSGSAIVAFFSSRLERARALSILKQDRALEPYNLVPSTLVSRRSYRRMWRNQLREHLSDSTDLWPLRSRYEP